MVKERASGGRRVWRVVAVVVGLGGGLCGVVLMVGASMFAGYGRTVGGGEAWDADEVRMFWVGFALAALAVATSVGLWRGQRWARVVVWALTAAVAALAALVAVNAVLAAVGVGR